MPRWPGYGCRARAVEMTNETNPPAHARANILADGRPEILADGYSVSAYALSCGAVQATERLGPNGWRVELYREHGATHVRAFDYAKRDNGAPLDVWRTWHTFPAGELKNARACAFRLLRAFGWHDVRTKRRRSSRNRGAARTGYPGANVPCVVSARTIPGQ